MKRTIIVLALLGICTIGYASIETAHVRSKIFSIISSIRDESVSSAVNINNLKSKASSLVSSFGGSIDAGDKTKLTALNTKVVAAKAALDDLIAYIDANFASIK